jgi:hypothetical protein
MISAFEQSRPVRLIDPVEAVAAQPTPHRLVEAPALVLIAAGLPADLATFRQGLDHLAPVRPGLVSFEPDQGNLPAMDYPLDRLVIANQLIRDQQTTIIFQHLGFSLMSRWQARIGYLD